MKLQNRDLSIRMKGDDVKLLQQELGILSEAGKLDVQIDQSEISREYFGDTTHQAVIAFQKQHGLPAAGAPATGIVDERTAKLINAVVDVLQADSGPTRFIVRGQVRYVDGKPFSDGLIRVFDKDLRSEELLGEVRPDKVGRYEIKYSAEQFSRAEKERADLRVSTISRDGRELATTKDIRFNAGPVETIDLVIGGETYRGPSEYERLVEDLTPLLQGLSFVELKEDEEYKDITFLSRETGNDAQRIEFLIFAAVLSQEIDDLPNGEAVCYGLIRHGLPKSLSGLLAVGPQAHRRALEAAIHDNIIPANLQDKLDNILELLQKSLIKRAFDASEEHKRLPLVNLLDTVSLSRQAKEKIVDISLRHEGSSEDVWQSLREQFAEDEVDELQFALQTRLLTQGNILLVKAIKERMSENETSFSLREVAKKFDATALGELIDNLGDNGIPAHIRGETREERRDNYVNEIVETLKASFPTTYVGLGVAVTPKIDLGLVKLVLARNPGFDPANPLFDQLDWGGLNEGDRAKAKDALELLRREIKMFPALDHSNLFSGDGEPAEFHNPIRDDVARFFENEPDFELRHTHINSYIAEHKETVFSGIADGNREKVVDQLKLVQRIHRVAPKFEHMEALLADELHSSYAIANLPKTVFVARFKGKLGGEAQALHYYANAQQITSTNTQLFANAYQELHDVAPYVISGPAQTNQIIKQDPTWQSLFGRLDFCDCDHCRSVYSPAAYFVDLLQFLASSGTNTHGLTPLDVLVGNEQLGASGRRPDLPHIPLTCENTNTVLPYVDLVNEILEYYIGNDGKLDEKAPRDTQGVTAQELSINPQHTNIEAYKILQSAVYPFSLPFNRPLEVTRTYLKHLGTSRHQVMRTFQTSTGPSDRDIAIEYLGVSPQEHKILTGTTGEAFLYKLYGYGDSDANTWMEEITAVSHFLQRTGIEYVDLCELLKTRFVNPNVIADPDQAITINVKVPAGDSEPLDVCNLDNLELDKDKLDEAALDRLQRFIRLWQKLGWAIPDVDRVLVALGATDIDDSFLQKLARVQWLRQELKLSVSELTSLWAAIETYGKDALYDKLFLNKAVLNPADEAFALDAQGTELKNTSEKLSYHIPAILAALRVTETDLAAIRVTSGLDGESAALHLTNLSTLYRYAALARALKVRIKELIALMELNGTEPFTPGDPAPTVEFVQKVRKVRDACFSVSRLGYIYRHLTEPARGIGPMQEQMRLLAKQLHDDLRKIAAETELVPDPTSELTQNTIAAIWEQTIGDEMIGLLNNTAVYRAELTSSATLTLPGNPNSKISYDVTAQKLKVKGVLTVGEKALLLDLSSDAVFQHAVEVLFNNGQDAESDLETAPSLSFSASGKRVTYNGVTRVLQVVGPITLDEKSILLDLSSNADYQDAVEELYQQPRTFLNDTLAGLLDISDAQEQLLDHPIATAEDSFQYLLQPLLRHLRETKSRSLVTQTLSNLVGLDEARAEFLIEKHLVLSAGSSQPLIDHFLTLRQTGLSATYFNNPDLKETQNEPVVKPPEPVPTIDFHWGAELPDPAITTVTFSARWSGYIVPPYSEAFTFHVSASDKIRLSIDGEVLIDAWQSQSLTEHSGTIELKAGRLYQIELEFSKSGAEAQVQLLWNSRSTPRAIIPRDHLLPAAVYETFVAAHTRLEKSALLVGKFELTVKLLTYLKAHKDQFDDFDLNALPLNRDEQAQVDADAVGLFKSWERLFDLAGFQRSLPSAEVSLADLFQVASTSTVSNQLSEEVRETLLTVTGWDSDELNYLADKQDGFDLTDEDFKDEKALLMLKKCLALGKRLGISTRKPLAWARVEPDAQQPEMPAEDIVNTVKAKYDDKQWLEVAKPLNNTLRDRQREALTVYVMGNLGITASNQLVEYFLIDVNMTSCMATSRIKQAISSVQLFIQRCLMNLEDRKNDLRTVSPAAIDADRWKWMKNYRVWEANRKVFLYPENWIEPELRDNKSPFFKELESELLQNELTTEKTECAFLHYLEKLDEVARLEIVGLYWEKKTLIIDYPESKKGFISAASFFKVITEGDEILHVFGRTFNPPHHYYYRRLLISTDTWTPWERVDLDIVGDDEGVHLIPVVYNRRLYLFWPIFEEKPGPESDEHSAWREKLEELENKKDEAEKSLEESQKELQEAQEKCKNLIEKPPSEGIDLVTDLADAEERLIDTESDVSHAEEECDKAKQELEDHKATEPMDPFGNGRTYWQVKLAWSEYRQNRWTPKQLSSGAVVVPHFWDVSAEDWSLPNRRDITFAATAGSALVINVNLTSSPDPTRHDEEDVRTLGVFWMDRCKGKLNAALYLDPHTEYWNPTDSEIAYMAFEQELNEKGQPKTDELILTIYPLENYTAKDPSLVPDKAPYLILRKTQTQYRALFPHHHQPIKYRRYLGDFYPFFYQDGRRTYSVVPKRRRNATETATRPLRLKEAVELRSAAAAAKVSFGVAPHSEAVPVSRISVLKRVPETSLYTKNGIASVPASVTTFGTLPGSALQVIEADNLGFFPEIELPIDTLRFSTFFHPHVCTWTKVLKRKGVHGLFSLDNQRLSNDGEKTTRFQKTYLPTLLVHPDHPKEDIDFRLNGAYALYNWELFFHAPLLICTQLKQNQRFELAQKWFHYIFDPTDNSPDPIPQRYWKVLPFYNNSNPQWEQINSLLYLLSINDSNLTQDQKERKEAINRQVEEWRNNPFNPHLLARMRITAYQKTVVMKYLDNLIAWADQLFRRDSIESTNEATQLYISAANILGPRPQRIPSTGTVQTETYHTLREKALDPFSNALVAMETEFPLSLGEPQANGNGSGAETLNLGTSFYFCIPQNDKLLSYWDTVADRLFKIRHCMNIEGIVRELPLFEPPIDPALLVRAFAKGVDISSVLNDLHAPLPQYRFTYMLQKTLELCTDLKALGNALLQTLEKKDAEELAALHAGHETNLLEAVKEIKKQQVNEAKQAREALDLTKVMTEIRRDFYEDVLQNKERNKKETEQIDQLETAQIFQLLSQGADLLGSTLALIPDVSASINIPGPGGSIGSTFGGSNFAEFCQLISRSFSFFGAIHTYQANMAALEGGWERRSDDWQLQLDLANKEIELNEKQYAAAEIREAIAQNELDNHEKQIERAQEIEDFLRNKHTNQELYTWMVTQISQVFFQTYKLAYDLAKRAERAYRHELGLNDSNFIQFGYWDNLRKGLLSGEWLYNDLKRMEVAYLEKNKRHYELTKHVSMAMLNPQALLQLREKGWCEITIPEIFFDLDFPGQYMRRIKSVSMTIPCVTGPYTNVSCKLTLLGNRIRRSTSTSAGYTYTGIEDNRFMHNLLGIQSIATSSGQNDSGLFELNFRDERYLPFEGAGVISRWRLELPQDFRQFDYDTISDVIIHINYTAREGGEIFKNDVTLYLQEGLNKLLDALAESDTGLIRLFSMKQEFSNELHQFLYPPKEQVGQVTTLKIARKHFPYFLSNKTLHVQNVQLILKLKEEKNNSGIVGLPLTLAKDSQSEEKTLGLATTIGNLPSAIFPITGDLEGEWILSAKEDDIKGLPNDLRKPETVNDITHERIKPEAIEDMVLMFNYKII